MSGGDKLEEFVSKEARTQDNQLCNIDENGEIQAIRYRKLNLPVSITDECYWWDTEDLLYYESWEVEEHNNSLTRMEKLRWEKWYDLQVKQRKFELKHLAMENHKSPDNNVLKRARRLACSKTSNQNCFVFIHKILECYDSYLVNESLVFDNKKEFTRQVGCYYSKKFIVRQPIRTFSLRPQYRTTSFIEEELYLAQADYIRSKEFYPKFACLPENDDRVKAFNSYPKFKEGCFKGKSFKNFFGRIEHYQQGFIVPAKKRGRNPKWKPLGWTPEDKKFRYFPENGYVNLSRVLNALRIQFKDQESLLMKFYSAFPTRHYEKNEEGKWIEPVIIPY